MTMKLAPTETLRPYGDVIDLVAPHPGCIDIREIALSLAKVNRWPLAASQPYSTAQHAVHVAGHVFRATDDARLACHGLLLNAADAYLGRIDGAATNTLDRWAKGVVDRAKAHLHLAVVAKYGLDAPTDRERALVLDAAAAVTRCEYRDLCPREVVFDGCPDPAPIVITPWPWDKAAERFLDAWDTWATAADLRPRYETPGGGAVMRAMFGDGEPET